MGVRSSVLHRSERSGRWVLAGQSRYGDGFPADDAGGLCAGEPGRAIPIRRRFSRRRCGWTMCGCTRRREEEEGKGRAEDHPLEYAEWMVLCPSLSIL